MLPTRRKDQGSRPQGVDTLFNVRSVSSRFLDDVLRCLSTPQKTRPSKYFYDAEGSRLFEATWEL